ncbi:unnamed protein product [Effrenium voratum]|nr:unnamed protein product [Effrenium voratum]
MKCPGSKSWIHASAEVEAVADASCDDVMSEMIARVTSDWKDPHNGGTYSVLSKADGELNLQRVTGNKKFTDKMTFTFSQEGSQCAVNACSESQSFSIGDFSTNYCNLRSPAQNLARFSKAESVGQPAALDPFVQAKS